MATLTEYKNYIKRICKLDTAYVGRIDAKVENCVGVYNLKPAQALHKPLGGHKRYDVKGLSVLVHGSTSKAKTEAFAQGVYDALAGVKGGTISGKKVIALQLLQNEPIDVDYDDNSIYEYVIELLMVMEV